MSIGGTATRDRQLFERDAFSVYGNFTDTIAGIYFKVTYRLAFP